MPIIYSLLYVLAVFIPYAGTTMTIIGGTLFSPLVGTVLVITLSSFASVLPFLLAKKLAREKIQHKLEHSKYKKYVHHTDNNSFMFALYMRLLPIIPYELQNYILGLIDISTPQFIVATFVGLLPGTFFLIYLGNTLVDIRPTKLAMLGLLTLFSILLPFIIKKYTRAEEIVEGEPIIVNEKEQDTTRKKNIKDQNKE